MIGRAAALCSVLALAGCLAIPGAMAPDRVSVAGGSVVIAGPPGYCVDRMGSHDTARGAFVLLGSCAALDGTSDAPQPDIPAVLAAAVSAGTSGAGIAGNEKRLAAYFKSSAGRAALSRSGKASTVRILGYHGRDGAFFLHLRDTSAFRGRSDRPDSWRVLFDVNGHIVTLSVMGPPGKRFRSRDAEFVLRSFMARVRQASRGAKVS